MSSAGACRTCPFSAVRVGGRGKNGTCRAPAFRRRLVRYLGGRFAAWSGLVGRWWFGTQYVLHTTHKTASKTLFCASFELSLLLAPRNEQLGNTWCDRVVFCVTDAAG
jgi:hypothetical protein